MPATADAPAGRLMYRHEVAALFGVKPRVVTWWADTGKLRPVRTPGGHRRYREAEVRALYDSLNPDAGAA